MSNFQKTKEYFEENPAHLKHAKEEYPLMYHDSGKKINTYLSGITLDIGSGGIINYNPVLAQKVILVDISIANKENAKKNVFFLNSTLMQLGIKQQSVDCVIMQHLLHHLADDTLKKSKHNLVKGFREIASVLKEDGTVIIVEGVVPYCLELLQKILFPINKILYRVLFNFPMVLQYSQETILSQLHKEGFILHSIEEIDDGTILPIFGLNLPRKYIPLKHKLFVAKKCRSL